MAANTVSCLSGRGRLAAFICEKMPARRPRPSNPGFVCQWFRQVKIAFRVAVAAFAPRARTGAFPETTVALACAAGGALPSLPHTVEQSRVREG